MMKKRKKCFALFGIWNKTVFFMVILDSQILQNDSKIILCSRSHTDSSIKFTNPAESAWLKGF